MNRRELLLATTAALVLPGTPAIAASGHVPYSRENYEQALASGEPFMLDFFATW